MLFFDDAAGTERRKFVLKEIPPTPETGWRPPTHFPNLSGAKAISFDVETKEPDFDHGPGWGREQGHVVGIGIGATDALGNIGKWYFPIRHEVEPEYNLDPKHVISYARDVLERTPHIPKVGANLLYDIGWLTTEDVYVTGELHDVQYAEALLHDDGQVNLDHLGFKYLQRGKEGDAMYDWQSRAYGGSANDKQRANIYRTSPRLVGPYGEGDVALPIEVLQQQWPRLQREGQSMLYRMECDLIYLMARMRLAGVHVNIPRAEQLYAELNLDIKRQKLALYDMLGFEINWNASASIAKAFDKFGIKYPRTADGAPSFKRDYLKALDHPLAAMIMEGKMFDKTQSTFLRSYLLERHHNGFIHCTFSQLRSDDGGTVVGRFASSDPNLQNIPVRPGPTEEKLLNKDGPFYDPKYKALGQRVRELFDHDPGHFAWETGDFSQIQYRYMVHFAVGKGANEVRQEYITNPKTDYHDVVQKTVHRVAGLFIERRPIKNINFGLAFGMGKDKLASQLGVTKDKATETMTAYHTGAPYVRATSDFFTKQALETGEIVSILGRKSRFNLWEPARQSRSEDRPPALTREHAERTYGTRIQRAYGHKALNRMLQMCEGDHMKKGMWDCWKAGVFNSIGVPRLTVHDELGSSVRDDSPESREAYAFMRYSMEHAVKISIPTLYTHERGPNWGECH